MSEEDVRGGMKDAIVGEPPLDFDPDELMRSARQQVKRRRTLWAAGAATVAVAVLAVAVPLALGRDQGTTTQAADQPVSTSTAPSTTSFQWPPRAAKPVRYTTDQLRARGAAMRKHLQQALPSVLTGASDFEFGQFGGEAEGQFYDGQDSVNTHISFTIEGKRYSLVVEVRAPVAPGPDDCDAEAPCQKLGVKDGGMLTSSTLDMDQGTILTVRNYRATGAVVSIAAYNYDMATQKPPVYQPTIPLTLDQLLTLASDPDLRL